MVESLSLSLSLTLFSSFGIILVLEVHPNPNLNSVLNSYQQVAILYTAHAYRLQSTLDADRARGVVEGEENTGHSSSSNSSSNSSSSSNRNSNSNSNSNSNPNRRSNVPKPLDARARLAVTDFGKALRVSSLERRVRVINMHLNASANHADVFKYTDADAVVTACAKNALQLALSRPLNDTPAGPRAYLNHKAVEILHKYRKYCSRTSPKSQLVLPDSLKLLPLYIMGLLKHPALLLNPSPSASSLSTTRPASSFKIRANERATALWTLIGLPVRKHNNFSSSH